MPKSLDLERLKRFEPSPVPAGPDRAEAAPESAKVERWPSREALVEGQINIKGPLSTIRRFKALCKADRRTYADMLDILMTELEKR
jgi:hypothetical protein